MSDRIQNIQAASGSFLNKRFPRRAGIAAALGIAGGTMVAAPAADALLTGLDYVESFGKVTPVAVNSIDQNSGFIQFKTTKAPSLVRVALDSLATKVAEACHITEGQPQCIVNCPERRVARIELIGAHFEDTNRNLQLDFSQGERFVSTVGGDRFMEIVAWGCGSRIETTDPRNKIASVRRLIAYQEGNGLGIDIETGNPFAGFAVNGIEDMEEGIDKITGQRMALPVLNFQFRAYTDGEFKEIIFDKIAQKPVAYEGCAYLCPEDDISVARYYIGTAKQRADIAALGLRYRPEEMAQPTGSPRDAVWSRDVRRI